MSVGMIIYMSVCGLLVLWFAYLVWAETQKEYEI